MGFSGQTFLGKKKPGFGAKIPVTVGSNAITVGRSGIYEATATATLKTINGGSEGDEIILRAASGAVLTVEDGTGNIQCTPGFIITGSEYDNLRLLKSGTNWESAGKNPN